MRRIAILLLSAALAACTTQPATAPAPQPASQAPPSPASARDFKTATPASMPVSASVATAATASSSPYVRCKIVFYDEPPKVPAREIVPLCERKGNQVFFASGYSEKDQRSIWSAYRLTARMVQRIDDSDLDRAGYGFKKNETLNSQGLSQPSDSDYANSESFMKGKKYQRGHYAPAETMSWAEPALDSSFLLTNVGPNSAR